MLTSQDPRLPLPDPRYLKLHAAWSRVAHFSGAGQHVNRILSSLECAAVLANDGSSAGVLSAAMLLPRLSVY